MQSFKSLGSTHRFLSIHPTIYNTYNVQRHVLCSFNRVGSTLR